MDDLTLTVGNDTNGRKIAIITRGGHPQRDSHRCEVLTVEVVQGWGRKRIDGWFQRMREEKPWETRH